MARERKTLPKNFKELLAAGDISALKAVFDICETDATESNAKRLIAIAKHKTATRAALLASTALLAVFALTACALGAGSQSDADNPADVVDLVRNFGSQFQWVQLIAPAPTPERGISEKYSDFVTTELLEKWTDNPETAPGRVGSSPWPDRIEDIRAVRLSETRYTVDGTVIWISSAELKSGGAAFVQPIQLRVVKSGAEWKISEVILGENLEGIGKIEP
ncbi:MAG: hypothetical protein LBB57_04595 [Clostridiales Family XIII bacterium]|jgi:hypothetical protein|nr:hypothetical protein [Clostridiales Family XIII bacterium]